MPSVATASIGLPKDTHMNFLRRLVVPLQAGINCSWGASRVVRGTLWGVLIACIGLKLVLISLVGTHMGPVDTAHTSTLRASSMDLATSPANGSKREVGQKADPMAAL